MATTKPNPIDRRAGICTVHDDLAWQYKDGSVGCRGVLVLETSGKDCVWAPMPANWRRFE